tara:strand:+ start:19 stop:1359 length:1341 start_codon:yes stop_codon:yes gene_type:complete
MSDFSTFFPSGGGGSGTIGALASFVPDPTATFVAGQEVYTDPADSSVWLRSAATLTSQGSGVLDASIYRDSVAATVTVSNTYVQPTSAFPFEQPGGCYVGNNKFLTCPKISNPTQRNVVYDVSLGTFSVNFLYGFCQLFDGLYGTANGNSGYVGAGNVGFPSRGTYNSTHHFLQGNLNNYLPSFWREDPSGIFNIRYIPFTDTTNATTRDPYANNTLTFKSPFAAIGLQNYNIAGNANGASQPNGQHLGHAITNPSSNERHWFIKDGNVCSEYTFNSAAANNTNPYTATGNSITIPFSWNVNSSYLPRNMFAEGNDLYFVWTNSQPIYSSEFPAVVYKYDATTRALISTLNLQNPIGAGTGSIPAYLSAVPAAITGSTVQFWAPDGQTYDVMTFIETIVLRGPFTDDATYPEITAKTQLLPGTSFNAKQIYSGEANESIYMWLKIA